MPGPHAADAVVGQIGIANLPAATFAAAAALELQARRRQLAAEAEAAARHAGGEAAPPVTDFPYTLTAPPMGLACLRGPPSARRPGSAFAGRLPAAPRPKPPEGPPQPQPRYPRQPSAGGGAESGGEGGGRAGPRHRGPQPARTPEQEEARARRRRWRAAAAARRLAAREMTLGCVLAGVPYSRAQIAQIALHATLCALLTLPSLPLNSRRLPPPESLRRLLERPGQAQLLLSPPAAVPPGRQLTETPLPGPSAPPPSLSGAAVTPTPPAIEHAAHTEPRSAAEAAAGVTALLATDIPRAAPGCHRQLAAAEGASGPESQTPAARAWRPWGVALAAASDRELARWG